MEVDPELLHTGRLALKVFNPAVGKSEWDVYQVEEVNEDEVIYSVEDSPDEMHLETIDRRFIEDGMDAPRNG